MSIIKINIQDPLKITLNNALGDPKPKYTVHETKRAYQDSVMYVCVFMYTIEDKKKTTSSIQNVSHTEWVCVWKNTRLHTDVHTQSDPAGAQPVNATGLETKGKSDPYWTN